MKLRNSFSDKTRLLFLDTQYCLDCGSNQMPEIHHISGRQSKSPLNAIVLCHDCHARCGHNELEEKKYFEIALLFLMQIGYSFTDDDIKFVEKNDRLYSVLYDLKHKING